MPGYDRFVSGGGSSSSQRPPNRPSATSPSHNSAVMPGAYMAGGGDDTDIPDYLINYNERFADASPALFRDRQIDNLMTVLISRDKPSALLTGAPGTGKTKIVEDVARRVANADPSIPKTLRETTIYEVVTTALVSDTGVVGTMERRVQDLISFATDNDVVLFIDEMHVLFNRSNHQLYTLTQALKPAMARGDIRIIGATTSNEAKTIYTDPAFKRRISEVIVPELDRAQTQTIVEMARSAYVDHYNTPMLVSDEVCQDIVECADTTLGTTIHRPDSAVTLLDKSLARLSMMHAQMVASGACTEDRLLPLTRTIVADTASTLVNPSGDEVRFNRVALRNDLRAIKGQSCIDDVYQLIVRDQLAVFPRTKPLSMLFAGPSGVGKTETARIIARHVSNSEPIVLNMANYSEKHNFSALTGSSPGYVGYDSHQERPLDALLSNPHQVIVLDELEKAHPSIHAKFLSALDTGVFDYSDGTVVDMSKAIIVATTNAAKKELSTTGSFGFARGDEPSTANDPDKLTHTLSQHFATEFLGRFNLLIGFSPLSRQVYGDIINDAYLRAYADVDARYHQYLPDQLPDEDHRHLIDTTYQAHLGARPARRAVSTYIEDTVANALSISDNNDDTEL